jgi:hypothetical protein
VSNIGRITTMIDLQQKHKMGCGISVCRGLIFGLRGKELNEEDILSAIDRKDFSDNSWKADFLNEKGSMPREFLVELLEQFSLNFEIKSNIKTAEDFRKYKTPFLLTIRRGLSDWHALLIRKVDQENIVYMDPCDGQNYNISVVDFNNKKYKGEDFPEILVQTYNGDKN